MISAPEYSEYEKLASIKAVCLDIDDTVLDNAASSRAGLKAMVGNDAAWSVWRRTTEKYYARLVAREIDFDTMCRQRTRAFFAAFGEELSEAEAAEREKHRMAAMRCAWRLFDDAWPCLDWLRSSGFLLAVITNAPSDYQRDKIASLGLADVFDTVVISEEVEVAKPDTRIFQAACGALGLPAEQIVHVGDRLDLDANAATRAGMHGVWLNRCDRTRMAPSTVPMIAGLDELPELLVCDLPNPLARPQTWSDGQRLVGAAL